MLHIVPISRMEPPDHPATTLATSAPRARDSQREHHHAQQTPHPGPDNPMAPTNALFDPNGTPKLPFDALVVVFEQLVDPGLDMRRTRSVRLGDVRKDLQAFARARRAITCDDTWRAIATALRLPVEKETHKEAINRWCRVEHDVEEQIMTVWLQSSWEAMLWCARVYKPMLFIRNMARTNRVDAFMGIVRLYRVTNVELVEMRDEFYNRIGFFEWYTPEVSRDEDDSDASGLTDGWFGKWGWWDEVLLIFRYAVENTTEDGPDCLDALMSEYEPALVVDAVVLQLRHSPYAMHARARRDELWSMIEQLFEAVPKARRVEVANDVIGRVDRAGHRFARASARPKAYLASVILHVVDAVGEEQINPGGDKAWEYVTLEELRAWEETEDSSDLPWNPDDSDSLYDPEVDAFVEYEEEDISDHEEE